MKELAENDLEVGAHISQFGWQFEKQFYTKDSGVTMVTEWAALVGGREQRGARCGQRIGQGRERRQALDRVEEAWKGH